MKDYLKGASKLKTIMGHKTYACRACGLLYDRYETAKLCCSRKNNTFTAARKKFDKMMAEIKGEKHE